MEIRGEDWILRFRWHFPCCARNKKKVEGLDNGEAAAQKGMEESIDNLPPNRPRSRNSCSTPDEEERRR